jgi:hypothetical protein
VRISIRYPAVELVTGVSYALAGWALGPSQAVVALPIVLLGITSVIVVALFALRPPRSRRPVMVNDRYRATRHEALLRKALVREEPR